MLDVGYLRTATTTGLASSIIASKAHEEEQRLIHEKQPQQIDIDLLFDNPFQPRVAMEEESLQQLSDTIASHGFQGVLVARAHPQRPGTYQLTAGHRRREAAKRAGLKTLPVIVHNWTDQDMATLAATENIQREDLSPLEEGKLFQIMIDQMNLTQLEVAAAIKKDRGYVRNRLRLAKAPSDIQAFIEMKTDSMRAVIYLLDIEDQSERAQVIDQLLNKKLTTEDLPGYIEELKRRKREGLQSNQDTDITQSTNTTYAETASVSVNETNLSSKSPSNLRRVGVPSEEEQQDYSKGSSMSQARLRKTKLKTIMRYLADYQRLLDDANVEEDVFEDERELLIQVRNTVQQLADTLN
ncbi:ParB/RepB/Spo0J family partition protein [Ktedonospora formicarum]|nr:ParB/RepB/Spo0J family partition protein [Ktedonospora formicarum]